MKNIQGWAAAAVVVVLAACTTEVTSGSDGGTGSTASGGTAGAAGSTTTSSGAGGSSTGGSGGSNDGGGAVCTAKAGDSACRTCALQKCHDEVCGCESNSACSAHVDDFYTCLSGASMLDSCGGDFSVQANGVDGG